MGVPEPQRFDAARWQKRRALGIVMARVRQAMLAAVQLNVQGRFLAEEIQIVDANGMLTAEFVAIEAAVTQPASDLLLRPSVLFAELAGAFNVGHEGSLAKRIEMGKLFFSLALILTFSPWEKEEPSNASGFAEDRPASTVAGINRPGVAQTPTPSRWALQRGPGFGTALALLIAAPGGIKHA
jgi:hypothetical protein